MSANFKNPLHDTDDDDAPTKTSDKVFSESPMKEEDDTAMEHTHLQELWLALTAPGNAVAGVAVALHVNIYLLALALILSTPYFPTMACIQMATIGTIFLQVSASLFSPYRGFAIANCDTVPGAVMVAVIAYMVDYVEDQHLIEQDAMNAQHLTINGNVTTGELFPSVAPFEYTECYDDENCMTAARSTILVGIILSNLIVAGLLFAMASGHAARVIAFVPTTVQAAFLAGVGWKILKTGVTFMVSRSEMKDMAMGKFDSSTPGIMINLVLVLFLGVVVNYVEIKFHHSRVSKWLWPIMLAVLVGMFYVILAIVSMAQGKTLLEGYADAQDPANVNSSFPELPRGMGWLLSDENSEESWFPQYININLNTVHWGAIFSTSQAFNYALLVIISVLSILLNTVAIEEETGLEINLDSDLKTTALGNLLAAPFGGFIGYASAHKTLICHGMGGRNFAGIWSAAYFFWFWAMGHLMARYIPIPIIGGFIAAIGMELLVEWLWHMRHKLSKSEMKELQVLFLLMTISFIGGFLIGMLLSLLAFTARYVQTPVIKTALDGSEYQGKALRDWRSKTILLRYGSEILTLRLQGFVFFFTAEKLRTAVMELLLRKKNKQRPVKFLIFDFHMVDNVDATAVKKMKKVLRYCQDEGIVMILSDLSHDMTHAFEHDEVTPEHFSNLMVMDDVDLSVEWACDRIIEDPARHFDFIKKDPIKGRLTLETISKGILVYIRCGFGKFVSGEPFDSVAFRQGGDRFVYKKGETIAAQHDFLRGDEKLYFIAAGACIKVHDGKRGTKRLEKRYAGTVIGEMTFFLGSPRHDSIIADADETVVYEYSHKQIDSLKKNLPHIGEQLMRHVMQKLGDTIKRLVNENHILMVLDGEEEDSDMEEEQAAIEGSLMAVKRDQKKSKFQNGGNGVRDSDGEDVEGERADGAHEGQGSTKVHHHSGFGILDADKEAAYTVTE
jgi:SulP family sulfate permease